MACRNLVWSGRIVLDWNCHSPLELEWRGVTPEKYPGLARNCNSGQSWAFVDGPCFDPQGTAGVCIWEKEEAKEDR